MVFTTERLNFSRISEGDEMVFKAVYSDLETVRYVGDGAAITDEECTFWVEVTLKNYQQRGYGMFKMTDRNNGELIGCCGIVHPGDQIAPEIKYCFLKEHWGFGFATETVKGMIQYGSELHGIMDFVATVAPGNIPSQKVLKKCGFKLGKTMTHEDGSSSLLFFRGNPDIQAKV